MPSHPAPPADTVQDLGVGAADVAQAGRLERLYEQARRHGYSHEKALQCVVEGKVRCWCSCPTPCVGGAQRFVGCGRSFTPEHPDGINLMRGPVA